MAGKWLSNPGDCPPNLVGKLWRQVATVHRWDMCGSQAKPRLPFCRESENISICDRHICGRSRTVRSQGAASFVIAR